MITGMDGLSAAVIAGGMSKRFGSDKTLALLNGKPLIQWAVDGVLSRCSDVFVVCKEIGKYSFLKDITFIKDIYDIQCPMVGLVSLFSRARNPAVFMISADMPVFPFAALDEMFSAFKGHDAAVPFINGKLYPCAAIYHKRTGALFDATLKEGCYKIINVLDKLDTVKLGEEFFAPYDKEGLGFINANPPADLEYIADRIK